MMRRLCFALGLLLVLAPLPLCAEEIDASAIDAPSPEETPSPSEEKEPNAAIQFVQDVLDDKYPFTIDFGAEPGQHGSTIFVRMHYNWNMRYASSLELLYNSQNLTVDDFETATKGVLQSTNKSYGAQVYPLVVYLGETSPAAAMPFVELRAGMMYNRMVQNSMTGLFDTNGDLLGAENAGKYFSIGNKLTAHVLGPRFGYAVQFPLFRYLTIGYEGAFSPIYYLWYRGSLAYSSLQTDPVYDAAFDYEGCSWSLPSVSQTLYADICRYVRVKSRLEYTRLAREKTDDDNSAAQHALSLRYGIELVKPTKHTRKKSAHLWAGIYYQHEWNKGDGDFTRTDGWVLCFGT